MVKFILVAFATFNCFAVTSPDSKLTPGVLCSPQDPDFKDYVYPSKIARCNRDIQQEEKVQVAMDYNVPKSNWNEYEFDHLIPLCAGGSNNPENLWPQPKAEALQKDKLEDEICIGMQNGTLTQDEAVQKVHDWFNRAADPQP